MGKRSPDRVYWGLCPFFQADKIISQVYGLFRDPKNPLKLKGRTTWQLMLPFFQSDFLGGGVLHECSSRASASLPGNTGG